MRKCVRACVRVYVCADVRKGQQVLTKAEKSEEGSDDDDLGDQVLTHERRIVLAHKVPKVPSLLVAAEVLLLIFCEATLAAAIAFCAAHDAAETVALLGHDALLVPHQARHKHADLEPEIQDDADRGVDAEVLQGWERGRGPQSKRHAVCDGCEGDGRAGSLHHVCKAVLQFQVARGSVERPCQHAIGHTRETRPLQIRDTYGTH